MRFKISRVAKNIVCATIFLIYAASHFSFLSVPSYRHELNDVVFPFLKNRYIYTLAGVLELAIGVACLLYRRDRRPAVAVWFFISLMIWYRVGIDFLGGESACNCLGILGKLLGISKRAEQVIPIVTLATLGLLNLPWRQIVNHIKGRRIVAVSCSIVIAAVVGSHTAEASGILVEGKLRARAFNPTKATEYAFMRANSSFRALLVGTTYDIEITNNDVKLWTVRFVYDGSNALITAPADGDYYRTRTPSGKRFSAILSKEPVPALNTHDVFGLSVLWMVLCYPTHVAAGQLQNHSEIPLLWLIPRRSAVAYGYRWDADLADDHNAKSIQILRSSALDLDPVGEAMRPNLIIRDTVAAKNELTLALNVRRQQSDGFSVADLRVSGWESVVGGRQMPKNAQLQLALGESQTHKHFWRIYAFEIDRVSPAPDATVSLPQITGVTHVEDFRFAEKRGDHVYKASTYDLSPGASWPAHYDSQQVALREEYFKSIVRPSYRAAGHAVVWAALGMIIGAFTAVWLRYGHAGKNETTSKIQPTT